MFFASLLSPLPLLAQTKTHHVIFVITSPDQADWGTAMTLADHFIAGVKPDGTDVEVLAYGPGIESLKAGAPEAPQLAALEKRGVHFVACESAMRAFHIPKADLLPGVYVRSVRCSRIGYQARSRLQLRKGWPITYLSYWRHARCKFRPNPARLADSYTKSYREL